MTCILPDGMGNFWFGSLGGLFRASRGELLAATGTGLTHVRWSRLDRADGMPTRECSGAAQPSGWVRADGTLAVPTVRGLVMFDPARIREPAVSPTVFLREVRANGKRLEQRSRAYQAGPGRQRMEFRYRGLDLSLPEEMTYRTRLLPIDARWQESGRQRQVVYEGLPPGRYRFEVLAIHGGGRPSERPAVAEVVVRPFFWQTGWFVGTVGLAGLMAAAGAGWMGARRRMRKRLQEIKLRHAKETERARIARDLHDDLGAKATELSLIADLGVEAVDPGELALALGEISRKTRELVGSLDEIVWAVNPQEDRLRSLLEYVTATAAEFLARAGVAVRLDVEPGLPDRVVDSVTRHSVYLAVRECLNNTVKHAGAATVRLAISWREPDELEIVLEDDGCGFGEKEQHGYGLDNLRARMAECGGRCELSGFEGRGARVRLTVPMPARLAAD